MSLELTETVFIKKIGMNKREVEFLSNLLKTELPLVGFGSMDLSVNKKVMISLKLLVASGNFQKCFKRPFIVSLPQ